MANIDVAAPGADEAALITALRNLGFAHVIGQSAVKVSKTGDTSETVMATITIPAGAMGPNGALRVTSLWSFTNSGNAKRLRIRLGGIGGTVFFDTNAYTAQEAAVDLARTITNRNSEASQVSRGGTSTGAGGTTSIPITGTVDTTVAQDLVLTCQLSNSGETINLESYSVELLVP